MTIRFGRFDILRPLSRSGTSLALAQDIASDGRLVTLRVQPALGPLAEAVLDDEYRPTVGLTHPNLVELFEAGLEGEDLWLSHARIDGGDLQLLWVAAAKKGKGIPFPVSVHLTADIAQALGALLAAESSNGQPLVGRHFEVSPRTFFAARNGHGQLLHLSTAGSKAPAGYGSPEEAIDDTVTDKSHQFALGVLLWELFTGRRLFRVHNDKQSMANLAAAQVPRPSSLLQAFPLELEAIVMRMLERDPADRFDSFDDTVKQLRAYSTKLGSGGGLSATARFLTDLLGPHDDELLAWIAKEDERQARTRPSGTAPGGAALSKSVPPPVELSDSNDDDGDDAWADNPTMVAPVVLELAAAMRDLPPASTHAAITGEGAAEHANSEQPSTATTATTTDAANQSGDKGNEAGVVDEHDVEQHGVEDDDLDQTAPSATQEPSDFSHAPPTDVSHDDVVPPQAVDGAHVVVDDGLPAAAAEPLVLPPPLDEAPRRQRPRTGLVLGVLVVAAAGFGVVWRMAHPPIGKSDALAPALELAMHDDANAARNKALTLDLDPKLAPLEDVLAALVMRATVLRVDVETEVLKKIVDEAKASADAPPKNDAAKPEAPKPETAKQDSAKNDATKAETREPEAKKLLESLEQIRQRPDVKDELVPPRSLRLAEAMVRSVVDDGQSARELLPEAPDPKVSVPTDNLGSETDRLDLLRGALRAARRRDATEARAFLDRWKKTSDERFNFAALVLSIVSARATTGDDLRAAHDAVLARKQLLVLQETRKADARLQEAQALWRVLDEAAAKNKPKDQASTDALVADADRAYRSGKPDVAVAGFRAALKQRPSSAAAQLGLARALLEVPKGADEAVTLLKAAVERDPANPDLHYVLACALRGAGQSSDAAAEYERYVEQFSSGRYVVEAKNAVRALR